MKKNKEHLYDTQGRPLTQSLFLEMGYNVQYAVFTINDDDKTYKGKLYPSLKKLYMECEDPTEYTFALTHLINWAHWQRMNSTEVLSPMFDKWRVELEVAIRSDAVQCIRDMTADGQNFQAAKWLADKGWNKRGAGRPTKEQAERESNINKRIDNEVKGDIIRMSDFK